MASRARRAYAALLHSATTASASGMNETHSTVRQS